jgi:hypothetical protein
LEPRQRSQRPSGLLAGGIRRLDAYLRRKEGIFEFTNDPNGVLRVSIEPAAEEFALSDGTRVHKGEAVCVLHFWNEQLPAIPTTGPDLQWAMAMRRRMGQSLRALARAIDSDPRLRSARAFGGTAVFVSRHGENQVARLAGRYGFEHIPSIRTPSIGQRLHRLGENILVLGLQWAFNPGGLRGKPFMRPRERLWMSRQTLLSRHGADATAYSQHSRSHKKSTRKRELSRAGGRSAG